MRESISPVNEVDSRMTKLNIFSEFKKDPLLSIVDLLIRYLGGKKQFLPNSDELENENVKKLLERFRGESEKEILSNLLEWQNRNITFWVDRMYYTIALYLLLIISIYLLPINDIILKHILTLLLVLMGTVNITLMLSYSITLITTTLIFIVGVFAANPLQAQKFYPVTQLVIFSLVFGALLALIFYLALKYSYLKSRIPGFKLKDTFNVSLPIDKILKYKLAICRDYAKFTAVLLHNIFPNNNIYFILIPGHVAAGIKINEKVYILDQKLPVMRLDGWLRNWNRKTAMVYEFKILDSKRKLKLERCGMAKLTSSSTDVDTEKLTEVVTYLLGINQSNQEGRFIDEIRLPKLAMCYDNDEIVIYSMAKAVKLKLEDEMCGSMNRVNRIKITQDGNDLIAKVYLKGSS